MKLHEFTDYIRTGICVLVTVLVGGGGVIIRKVCVILPEVVALLWFCLR